LQGWIPKSNGKTRLLGIPTVTDRLLQQAVAQVIAIKFEMEFEDYSFGFRPNRNAQQAVLKAQEYINAGYHHIVDIDLKSFPPAGGLITVSCCNYCIARSNARSHYVLSANG
jgi:retron-type reverse transcriptase